MKSFAVPLVRAQRTAEHTSDVDLARICVFNG